MTEVFKQTKLATAIKQISLCAAGTALLASAGAANALDVKVGGYVKTDITYDLDKDLGPSLNASAVDTTGADSEETFRMHSLQSRVNFSATEGDLKIYVEGDFFTGDSSELVSNSRHFRLRHAYGKMGNLLIGQTWSTLMDANWVLYPSTVDFGGPAGATFVRQSQVRWTIADGLDLAFENAENRVAGETARDTLPDVVLRYASKGDVSWQIAGIFQQFEVDGGTADGESESNFGVTGGVNVAFGGGNSFSVKANSNTNLLLLWFSLKYVLSAKLNTSCITVCTINILALCLAYFHSEVDIVVWTPAIVNMECAYFLGITCTEKFVIKCDHAISNCCFSIAWAAPIEV